MFTFTPMPHTEAERRIAELPVVTREVMQGMLPELRAHAFTVAGLQGAEQMARVKRELAKVPAGESWEVAKKKVAAELKAGGLDPKTVQRRAELLLRTTAFRAYAAARYRNLMAQLDVFPFWQYKTAGDGRVRPAHLALNNQIFPAGHEIWQRIFPPWGWGCRCLVVPLTKRSADALIRKGAPSAEEAAAANLLPTQRAKPVLYSPTEADLITRSARLPGGLSIEVDPTWGRSPWSEKGNLRPSWDYLESLYKDDPEAFAAFREWSEKTEIPDTGSTVSAWVSGDDLGRAGFFPRRKAPAYGSLTELPAKLRRKDAAKLSEKIRSVSGATDGVLSEDSIKTEIDRVAEVLPPELANRLNGINVEIKAASAMKNGADATFFQGTLKLNENIQNATDARLHLRTVLAHESAHWLWPRLPVEARKRLKDFLAREGGAANWISEHVSSQADGSELLAYYFEVFFRPAAELEITAQNELHRRALNLVMEVLNLKPWER